MDSHEKRSALPADSPTREYQVLKAVNEALSNLLSTSNEEEALERSFKSVCMAIGCDGVYLFDNHILENNNIKAKSYFGIRYEQNEWKKLKPVLFEFPLETDTLKDRVWSMLQNNSTTIALCKDCPPKLNELLKSIDVESYLTFRIVIDDHIWGGISFVSRQVSTEWAENVRHLLEPFVSSVGNFLTRKRIEERLLEQKRLSESITSTIPDIILVVNLEKRAFTYHNISDNILGFEPREIPDLFEFLVSRLHPGDRGQQLEFIGKLNKVAPHEAVEKYFRLQHKDGHWVHFFERAKVFSRYPNGRLKEYLAVLQDITDSVKAQRSLKASEERYRNFINHSFDGIYYLCFEKPIPLHLSIEEQVDYYYKYGFIEECNMAFAHMYGGQDPSQIVGLRVEEVHGGAFFEYNKQSTYEFVKRNYRVINSETIEQDLNNNPLYILNHAIGDIKDGHLLGVWGTQQDITERRKTEIALQESESILKGIVNALPDLKFRINHEYVILDYYESENENESPLVPPSMFLGQKMTKLLPVSVTKPANNAIDKTLKYKKIQTFEYSLPVDGEIHYYEGRVSPMNEKEVILAVRNISDRKRVQIELKEKLRELDEKNKQLRDYIESNFQLENFAYIASHDLREPVRTMHSFAQLLQRHYLTLLDEKGKNYLNFIIQGAENMNRLIEDLLTYSRVSSEEAVFEQIDLSQLIQVTLRNLTSYIEEKQAKIQVWSLPPVVTANRTKLKQLFQNLIANGIKFHRQEQPPQIEISGIDHGEHWLFEVKDNGIGIPQNMQDKLFQLFKKIHYTKEHNGTGIGLALCKRIIEQHGGEIWVESVPGKGSSFYFTIKKQVKK